jgi:hypothetical protein
MSSGSEAPKDEWSLPAASAWRERGRASVLSFGHDFHLTGALMKTLILLIGWLLLFALCWPLALLALILWPVVWLLSLPFRLVGIAVGATLAFLRALLFLPARLLGYRPAY